MPTKKQQFFTHAKTMSMLLAITLFWFFSGVLTVSAQSFNVDQYINVDAGGNVGNITINYTKSDTTFCSSETPWSDCSYIWSEQNFLIDSDSVIITASGSAGTVNPRPNDTFFFITQSDWLTEPVLPYFTGDITFTFDNDAVTSEFSLQFDENGDIVGSTIPENPTSTPTTTPTTEDKTLDYIIYFLMLFLIVTIMTVKLIERTI